jgi:hypothetical protein
MPKNIYIFTKQKYVPNIISYLFCKAYKNKFLFVNKIRCRRLHYHNYMNLTKQQPTANWCERSQTIRQLKRGASTLLPTTAHVILILST